MSYSMVGARGASASSARSATRISPSFMSPLNSPDTRARRSSTAAALNDAANAARAGEPAGSTEDAPGSEQIATDAPLAPRQRKPREGTKQALLIGLLRGEDGATVEEMATLTGWRHHTVRGAIAGALKKRLGLDVASRKVEGRGRVYRLC